MNDKVFPLRTLGAMPLPLATKDISPGGDGTQQAPKVVPVDGLALPPYDYLACTYTGSNLTRVVYKSGGAGGTQVAQLDMTYDGSANLLTLTKS